MADPVSRVKTADVDARPARASDKAYPGTPRWVKVSGIVALVVILLLVIVMIVVGGDHSPMRHIPSASGPSNSSTIAIHA